MHNLYILNETYTNGFYYNLLDIVSIIAILCGICVIVSKNPVVSVLFLIGLFFSIASYLMLLGMNFIGLSYLLVYVGAVSILFLFILMLINVRISELITDNNNSFILAFMIGILLFIPIYAKGNILSITFPYPLREIKSEVEPLYNVLGQGESIPFSFIADNKVEKLLFVTSKVWDGALSEVSHITSIGNVIYTTYPIWLILTSLILLLAMVGAIIITIKQ